jgi:hypothetical protein
MKYDVLTGSRNPVGSILNSGFKRIPSVDDFLIQVQPNNELLREKTGIKRRLPPVFDYRVNATNKRNKYMVYQIRRLTELRDKGDHSKYWEIVIHLMKTSVSFRMSAFNRTYPDWWHAMSLEHLVGLNKEIDRVIKTWDDHLKYHRVYIPKEGSDTYRPLGVPEECWRVPMHMWSNFLTLYFRKDLEEFNHGFLPGKGTTSAWKEIIKKVLNKRYIYEFDLKQFFPSVNPNAVERLLVEGKVEGKIVAYLNNIIRCHPIVPKRERLDETLIKDKIGATYNGLLELGEIAKELMMADGFQDLWEYAKAQTSVLEGINPKLLATNQSVPQGLNISPILSILTLKEWYTLLKDRGINLIMYADDGIMYSNKPFEPYFAPYLIENKEKSGWVKVGGEWCKDLKFLGLLYNPVTKLIEGHTRDGSRLKFGHKEQNVFELIKDLSGKVYPERLSYLTNSNLLGLVQSKLYNGTWSVAVAKKESDWAINNDSWWGQQLEAKGDPTLSSEAVPLLGKIVKDA